MRSRIISIATGLIYAAVLVRAAAWYEDNPPAQGDVIALLIIFGLLLVSEPLFTRRFPRYPYLYLILQSSLTLVLLLSAPGMDFLPALFFPLSFQAVEFFDRRLGFLWIGAFTLAMSGPLIIGWDWQLPGFASVLINGGTSFLVGNFAHLIHRAEQASQENQRLLAEVEAAYHQLQDYAAQVEEYAASQERSRMARELHDSVTQTLFSMNLTVQGAQLLAGKDPERAAGQLDRLQELARSASGEIQVLVSQLRPRSVTGEGLEAALHRLAIERRERDGLQIQMEIRGDSQEKDMPEPVVMGLYRIAQEALNNVAKHAGTCEAILRLNLESQPFFLEVEDHGLGFEPDKVSRSLNHIGLPGMADRARELGWSLQIEAQPGQGTRIRVEENGDVKYDFTAFDPA
jgi:signal transduction histidine kinase